MLAFTLPYSFPHWWTISTSLDSFGLCPSWPRVPSWRHTSFQGPFPKAVWINFCQVCFLPPWSALHCVSTGSACLWVLIQPPATPQGFSTSTHFQALQTLLCYVGFLSCDSEWNPHKLTGLFTVGVVRIHQLAIVLENHPLDLFYLDMKTCLCCF